MKATIENLRGQKERVTLPKPHWSGCQKLSAGVTLQALYRGPNTKRPVAEFYSIWSRSHNDSSHVGTYYEELDDERYLHLCDIAGCEPQYTDAPEINN